MSYEQNQVNEIQYTEPDTDGMRKLSEVAHV